MPTQDHVNLWTSSQHAADYLGRANSIPHRTEGEATLLEFIPAGAKRILDLGTGDGRLLSLVKTHQAAAHGGERFVEAVALDFSPTMLQAVRQRFAGDASLSVVTHDLDQSLPALGNFDVVVSSFAIHHLVHERKRALYAEIYALLNAGGVFCNLEHVASPSERLHDETLKALGKTRETDDPSNKLLDVETQLGWLRDLGFSDVDCHWKWRELALLAGRKT